MRKELHLENEPINFIKHILKSFASMILLLLLAFIIVVITTSDLNDNYSLVIISVGITLILIFFTQFIFSPSIYLYSIITLENKTEIKWQKYGKHKSQKFENAQITAELVPYGRNNPYLKFVVKDNESELILKQFQFGEWTLEKFKQIQTNSNKFKII